MPEFAVRGGARERVVSYDGGNRAREREQAVQETPEQASRNRVELLWHDAESAALRVAKLSGVALRKEWREERKALEVKHQGLQKELEGRAVDAAVSEQARERYVEAARKVKELGEELAHAKEPRPRPPVHDEVELEPSILDRTLPPEQVLAWIAGLSTRERQAVEDRLAVVGGTADREDGFSVALANYLGDAGVRKAYEGWARAAKLKAGPGQPTLRDRFLSLARDPRHWMTGLAPVAKAAGRGGAGQPAASSPNSSPRAEGPSDWAASAASSSSPSVLARSPAGVVQRSPADQRQPTGHIERLIHLLTTTQPHPDEQMDEAYAFLASLAVPEMLTAIDGAAVRGALPQLIARSNAAAWFGRSQLLAAIYAVDLVRGPTKSPSDQRLHRASDALDQISREMQLQILSWMLHRGGVSIEATSLVEGAIAMREGADRDAAAAPREQLPSGAGRGAADDPSAPAGGAMLGASLTSGAAPAPITPAPWNPPGKQPGNLYVGNEAHDAIAKSYQLAHPADDLFLNHSPLASILRVFEALSAHQVNVAALSDNELDRKPDITNIPRRHLYEIKPLAAQAEGAAKAKMYLDLFRRAGVAMTLGPMGEPGTSGGLPAPAGVFMFESPEPGVITYQYRKGRLVPVPVAEPEPAAERRWRWELQPLTPAQKQAIVTFTVGGAMLLILMILLAPVGA